MRKSAACCVATKAATLVAIGRTAGPRGGWRFSCHHSEDRIQGIDISLQDCACWRIDPILKLAVRADQQPVLGFTLQGNSDAGINLDVDTLKKDITRKSETIVGKTDVSKLTPEEAYRAVAWSVRDSLLDAFFKTQEYWECA